jgi:hypothetical protein
MHDELQQYVSEKVSRGLIADERYQSVRDLCSAPVWKA